MTPSLTALVAQAKLLQAEDFASSRQDLIGQIMAWSKFSDAATDAIVALAEENERLRKIEAGAKVFSRATTQEAVAEAADLNSTLVHLGATLRALDAVLPMASEWFKYNGSGQTFPDEDEAALNAARLVQSTIPQTLRDRAVKAKEQADG